MVTPIPNAVQKIWEKWNIRGVILFSLSLQTVLILLAPLRKRTHRSLAVWFIWTAYLLADWAANFCVGLISKNQDNNKGNGPTNINSLMAFWAPFLLLHLGGPDTITAFALEDNELWLRHLLGLIFQLVATVYVFLLTIPENDLWIPTVLMFLAGIIKYTERTRALYLASMSTFRRSMVRGPDAGPNYAKLMEEFCSRREAGLPTRIEMMPEPDQKPRAGHDSRSKERKDVSDDTQVLNDAYEFYDRYRGLIVDMIFSFGEGKENRQFFLKYYKSAADALRLIEVELNYIYEVFYTKVTVVRHKVGYFFRFVSFSSTVAALGLFISEEKQGFHHFDVRVTYTLLYGAVALDTIGLLMLLLSDRTVVSSDATHKNSNKARILMNLIEALKAAILKCFLGFRRPKWSECKKKPYTNYMALSTPLIFRRWSGTISGHNLIRYCLHQCPMRSLEIDSQGLKVTYFKVVTFFEYAFDKVVDYFGAKQLLEILIYKENHPFLQELWEFIFEELKRKSKFADDVETMERICSARGEWVLRRDCELNPQDLRNLMPFIDTSEITFDESLIMWHIATHLCYVKDHEDNPERDFSMLLSDYMLYLLVMQPTMMSTVAGIGQIRFQDTCAEAIKFLSKRELEVEGKEEIEKAACQKLLEAKTEIKPADVKGDRSKSLLFDASRLAKGLVDLKDKKWKIISKVWVEMLSYAASHCRSTAHVQQLSKGGELISFVWFLMLHFGLGGQFQIKEGHARAKLIVGR